MRIRLITPAPAGSRKGNRVTALRWARILRELGHRVTIEQEYTGGSCDLMLALHARRSASAIARFSREHPGRPLLVALTGTDLYDDIRTSEQAQQSLELATRLILLQPMGIHELPEPLRPKAEVIYQSATAPRRRGRSVETKVVSAGPGRGCADALGVPTPPARPGQPARDAFDVCVLGHLRAVKDPFRTAMAARLLPTSSRVRVLHVGGALSEEMAEQARVEAESNPRYRWLGELPRWQALRVLARSRLLVLTSEMEGGANAISEALAASVPILASQISGSIGLLGAGYPGYFPVGDTHQLACLLQRAETDPEYDETLRTWCARLAPLVDPARERRSWEALLRSLVARSS
jgi:glycosyltransferase involved in cell wall biosynthesis